MKIIWQGDSRENEINQSGLIIDLTPSYKSHPVKATHGEFHEKEWDDRGGSRITQVGRGGGGAKIMSSQREYGRGPGPA